MFADLFKKLLSFNLLQVQDPLYETGYLYCSLWLRSEQVVDVCIKLARLDFNFCGTKSVPCTLLFVSHNVSLIISVFAKLLLLGLHDSNYYICLGLQNCYPLFSLYNMKSVSCYSHLHLFHISFTNLSLNLWIDLDSMANLHISYTKLDNICAR